jgi:HK97 family phage portal protein
MTQQPLEYPADIRRMTDEGYRRNTVVFVCVKEIVTSLARLPVRVYDDRDQEIEDIFHPLKALLKRPNPEEAWQTFLTRSLIHSLTAGDGFMHKARSAAGMPVELWTLRPDRMRVKLSSLGYIEGWRHSVDGAEKLGDFIPKEDVIRLPWSPDPLDDYHSMSPLHVAARNIDMDNKALDYLRAFFLNSGSPAGLLSFKERVGNVETNRIRALWKRLYGGARGWHELAVLDGDAEYQQLGSKVRELDLEHVWTSSETRICAAYGVPPIIAQLASGLKASTYSNYREAVKAFWTETLVPAASLLSDQLTFSLGTEFGRFRVELDTTGVEVLQEQMEKKRTAAVEGYKEQILTLDEAREMYGMDPIGGEEGESRKSTAVAPGTQTVDPEEEDDADNPDDEDDELSLPLTPEQFDSIAAELQAIHDRVQE